MHLLKKVVKDGSNGCLMEQLGALDCRRGCPICHLNENLAVLKEYFPDKENGPGMFFTAVSNFPFLKHF